MVCSRWPEPRKSKKNKKTKTADHMSTESDKNPNGVCSFVFLFFWIFEVFASPMGSAVFLFLEVFAWFVLLQMASSKRDCLSIL